MYSRTETDAKKADLLITSSTFITSAETISCSKYPNHFVNWQNIKTSFFNHMFSDKNPQGDVGAVLFAEQ